jgi:hypothetical protein
MYSTTFIKKHRPRLRKVLLRQEKKLNTKETKIIVLLSLISRKPIRSTRRWREQNQGKRTSKPKTTTSSEAPSTQLRAKVLKTL